MIRQPLCQLVPSYSAGRYLQNEAFLLVNLRFDFPSVQDQKHFHCCVTDSFVSVDKRMIANQSKS